MPAPESPDLLTAFSAERTGALDELLQQFYEDVTSTGAWFGQGHFPAWALLLLGTVVAWQARRRAVRASTRLAEAEATGGSWTWLPDDGTVAEKAE